MKHKQLLLLILASAAIALSNGTGLFAQPWTAGAPGAGSIWNPNQPANVGINIWGVPAAGVAWDPLEISYFGPGLSLPPAIRLSGTQSPGAVAAPDYGQLGFAVVAGNFSTLSTLNDLVLATQGIAEDVIISANGKNTGQIRFATKAFGVETERMTIVNNSGNVGIATVTPAEKLDVAGNIRFSQALMPAGLAGTAGDILQSNGAGVAPSWIAPSAAGGAWVYGGNSPTAVQTLGTITNFDLPFITSGTQKMIIMTSGRVGIGTASPSTMLDVNGDASVNTNLAVGGDIDITGLLKVGGASGTAGDVLVSNGGSSPAWADAGTQFSGTFWKVGGNGSLGGTQLLGTSGLGAGDLKIQAGTSGYIVLKDAGSIGINTATPSSTYDLDIAGSLRAVSATFTSDVRWKQDIKTVSHAVDKINALRGVTYTYRQDAFPAMNFPGGEQLGLIAQEVEAVIPQVVSTDETGYKGIAYQNLVALLIQGVKEQQVQIQAQSQQINEMASQVRDLQTRLAAAGKGVSADGPTTPDGEKIELGQNVPNPFNEFTTIPYRIPGSVTNAELVLYEAGSGREVERFLLTQRGPSEVKVGVAGLAAGAYVYGIIADGHLTGTRTMVVAR